MHGWIEEDRRSLDIDFLSEAEVNAINSQIAGYIQKMRYVRVYDLKYLSDYIKSCIKLVGGTIALTNGFAKESDKEIYASNMLKLFGKMNEVLRYYGNYNMNNAGMETVNFVMEQLIGDAEEYQPNQIEEKFFKGIYTTFYGLPGIEEQESKRFDELLGRITKG